MGACGSSLWGYSVTRISLSPLYTVGFTDPIIGAVLATLYHYKNSIGLALGFCGALVALSAKKQDG